eukprot:jgi/Tetstr1/439729/TSEL_028148.t1
MFDEAVSYIISRQRNSHRGGFQTSLPQHQPTPSCSLVWTVLGDWVEVVQLEERRANGGRKSAEPRPRGRVPECLVECFEEAYASEPQRYKNTACTACFGPLLAPVAVVERATWEAQFQLAAWNELGRDWRLSNAAKSFKLCGFPSALLANWVNDIVKKCREPSLEA